jgi:hypothetical protein
VYYHHTIRAAPPDQAAWRARLAVETHIINQAFTWNDLGQLASLGYPNDTALADAVEPPRTVSYTYANGALTAVPSFLSSISYHPNGMVNTVTHANGTKVVHGKDANDMARPASITLQRVSDSAVLWQTGAYAYDGAGTARGSGGWREAGCRAAARSRGGRVEAV